MLICSRVHVHAVCFVYPSYACPSNILPHPFNTQLESMSWGWFEEEEDFQQRAAAALRDAKAAYRCDKRHTRHMRHIIASHLYQYPFCTSLVLTPIPFFPFSLFIFISYSASKGGSKKASGGTKKYVGPAKLPHSTASAFGFAKGGSSSWASAGGHNGPAPSMKMKAAVSRVNAKESGNGKANSFANAFDSDSDSD